MKKFVVVLVSLCFFGSLYPEDGYFLPTGELNYELLINRPPHLVDYLELRTGPDGFWKTAVPKSQGIRNDTLMAMLSNINVNFYAGENEVHSLLMVKNGFMVMEQYGFDSGRICRMFNLPVSGLRQPGPECLHNVFSITKSVTSALIGIAIQEGAIRGVDQRVIEFCSDLKITNTDPRLSNITIGHLLTMTSGLDWDDTYASQPAFFNSKDIPSLYMNRPMRTNSGIFWNYDSASVVMLGYILQKATGVSLIRYAEQKLFQPLGITNFYWYVYSSGLADAGAGLSMTSRDLAKFGYLYLNRGKWQGKQVIPEEWIKRSTSLQITGKWGGYGYLWCVGENGIYHASGFGGQAVYVIPDEKAVVVCTSWIEPGRADREIYGWIKDYVLPAFR